MPDQNDTDFDKAFAEANAPEPAPAPVAAEPAAAPAPVAQAAAPAPAAAADDGAPASEAAAPAATEPVETVETLRAKLADMEHRERSSANRVSAFMRQNTQLVEQVQAVQKELKKLQTAAPAAAAPAVSLEEDPDFKDVLADAPDLRKSIEKLLSKQTAAMAAELKAAKDRLEELGTTTAETRQALEPISRRNVQSQLEETFTTLDSTFTPKWREDVRSDKFNKWIEAQPDPVRNMYETAPGPKESAAVLKLFYADTGAPRSEATLPPEGDGKGAAPAANAATDRLRKAAGIAPRGNSPASTVAPKDDFESAFDQANAMLAKTG